MRRADCVVSVLAGRALLEHFAYESCDRFYGGIHRAVCLRSLRGASANAAAGVCAGCVCALSDHLCKSGADGAEEPGTRAAREVRGIAAEKAMDAGPVDWVEQAADAAASAG